MNQNIQTFGEKTNNVIEFSLKNCQALENLRKNSKGKLYVYDEYDDLLNFNEDKNYSNLSYLGGIPHSIYFNSSINFGIRAEPLKFKRIERNLGLEIQRMLLCFWVLLFHSIKHSDNILLDHILHLKFHVPCFFFISFYFFFPILRNKDKNKMKLRYIRLTIPFILWPLIIWILNNLSFVILKKNRFGRILSFKDLCIQLIIGRKFFIQLWFIFNVLFLSTFFYISIFMGDNIFLTLLNFFLILCYYIQYSIPNYSFYKQFKDCVSYSVGHLIISFPIAITAFNLNRINLIEFLEKSILFQVLMFLISIILFIFGTPYTYKGIDKNLFSLVSFYSFHLMPINNLLSNKPKNIIYFITKYTKGIYCLHLIIKYYIIRFFNLTPSFFLCLYLYIICYILSFFGKKIFEKNYIRYLFI